MKYKTTQREIKNNFISVLSVGYCELQNLLRYFAPEAYTSGVYDWNADIYSGKDVGYSGVAVVTGYRPFGKSVPHDICEKYEKEACEVIARRDDYETMMKGLKDVLHNFIAECLENFS